MENKIKSQKKLGIWMDHAHANLMEFKTDPIQTIAVNSKFTHDEKEHSLSKSENLMHNKEQHKQSEYYKKLGEVISPFHEVVLFGPTEAKTELLNVLRANHHFDNIIITVEQADKLTDNQQHAFVRNHFAQ